MFSPKCAHCGEELPRSANFCVACGKPFHISDEATRPPAEIRPIRPINDSIKLPAPPKISALVPISLNEASQDRDDDSWRDEKPLDKSGLFFEGSGPSIDEAKAPQDLNNISIDQNALSQDLSGLSMDLDGSLLPTERSKRPWLYAALAAAFVLMLFAWPRSEKAPNPLLTSQTPDEQEEATNLPDISAPATLAAEPTPAPNVEPKAQPTKAEPKAQPSKTAQAAAPSKAEPKLTPKAEPAGPGILGALKAQEATPEPKPEAAPEPKPDATNNAANEAAGFLDEN